MNQENSIFKDLNDEQTRAVEATEGYIRIIAGAGSGKTRALTHRFAHLVKDLGVGTDRILSVTFTNKAALEMKRRIRQLIGNFDTGYINTFHGFCNIVLKEDIHCLSYPSNFSIIDESEKKSILKEIYDELELSSKDYTYDKIIDFISTFKTRNQDYVRLLIQPELTDLTDLIEKAKSEACTDDLILYNFLYKQRKSYNLDFDDLIFFALYIFKTVPDVLAKWQDRMEYIQVDEFQDVSSSQFELVSLLSKKHNNLFIVGDPDQNIYSWRGARIEYIVNFNENFPNVKTIYLNKNYRSRPEILMATNALIKKNTYRLEKELIPQKTSSEYKPLYYHGYSSFDEANWIASNIQELEKNGTKPDDIAVLYRANYISRPIEESFVKHGIGYVIYNGTDFYSRIEVKNCIAYLKMLVRDDDIAFLRIVNVPARNIGKKRIEFIRKFSEDNFCSFYQALKNNLNEPLFKSTKASEFVDTIEKYRKCVDGMKISTILDGILKDSGYTNDLMTSGDQERLDNIKELQNSVMSYEDSLNEEIILEDYLNQLALFTDKETKSTEGLVKLMTIHASKGLEFKYVFVCGLNEGLFPSSRVKIAKEMEEERRLAYVAFTRAEERLFLSESEGTNFDGSFRYPSRFLSDIDKIYLKYENEPNEKLFRATKEYAIANDRALEMNSKFFTVGSRVIHKTFGEGVIRAVNQNNEYYTIKFDNLSTERNIKINFVELI